MLSIVRTMRNLQKQLDRLDDALSKSFANLKRDFEAQAMSLERMNTKLIEQDRTNRQLVKIIARLQKQQDIASQPQLSKNEVSQETVRKHHHEAEGARNTEESCKRSFESINQPHGSQTVAGLTKLHMEILKHLMIIQTESGKRYISMRDLASELYPNKQYSIIKATLSEYIKKLHQDGFVEKIHKERLYLSYAEKSLQFADNQRLNKMRELISKPGVR